MSGGAAAGPPRDDARARASEALAPVLGLLEITSNLYVKALTGVDRETFGRRPSDHTNPLAWIAGHVLQSRARLLSLAGEARAIPWPNHFGPDGPLADPLGYPAPDDLLAEWREVTAALQRRLLALEPAALAAPPSRRVPSHDGSLLGAIAFAAYHEAYHVGQMGYLRKWHGLSPLVER